MGATTSPWWSPDPRIILRREPPPAEFSRPSTRRQHLAAHLHDDQPNPSIGDLPPSRPSIPPILYVGTRRAQQSPELFVGQWSLQVDGRRRHVDPPRACRTTRHIGRIVVRPHQSRHRVRRRARRPLGPNKERGVFIEHRRRRHLNPDPGTINEDTGVCDIAIDPESPNILYAAPIHAAAPSSDTAAAVPTARSIPLHLDGGTHWTKMAGGSPATGDIGRCCPRHLPQEHQHRLRRLVEHATSAASHRSEDKRRHPDPHERHQSAPFLLQPDPRRPQQRSRRSGSGGVNMYLSEDGGRHLRADPLRATSTATSTPSGSTPANSDHIVNGNDGGVWVTRDSGRNWRHLNNIALGPVLRDRLRLPEALPRLRRPAGQPFTWCGPSA